MTKEKPPTYSEIVQELLSDLQGPISIDEFTEKFFEIRVPGSKNPRASVRNKIREENGQTLIFADDQHILPIGIAYQGVRFRLKLTRKILFKGLLPLDDFEHYFANQTNAETLTFLDQDGSPLKTSIFETTKQEQSLLGTYERSFYHLRLKSWFKNKKARAGDHVLVTIQDRQRETFRLELESAARFDAARVAARDQELADIIYNLLEDARRENLRLTVAVPTAYARQKDKAGYPPNPIGQIIANDDRMVYDGWLIRYADAPPNMLQSMMAERLGISTMPAPVEFSQQEAEKVYRFKAALKYRKRLWRRIEIQGEQTLADFNSILMNAFEHDWDHMGGFWKLVSRGSKKRYREVEVGTVNPFGEGDGADTPIAGLGLSVGDRLKYVYDFGDWIEHEIKLEAIDDPDPEVDYPQIAAQNKPRYRYCEHCKEKDIQTIAHWICIECSNQAQREVLVCKDCLGEKHADHYASEMVY